MFFCTRAAGRSCAVFWEGVLLPQSPRGGDGARGHCCPRRGASAGPGRLGIAAAPGTWVLGERCRGCPHGVLLAGCLAPADPSRGVPSRGGSTVLGGVCDSPEAKPLGQAAPRGGGRDGQIDSSGGWTDGWMEKQMCTRDGWMDGEIDGCVGEGDAWIDRQMHRWRTDARSLPSHPGHAWGAELWRCTGPLPPGSSGSGTLARNPPGQRDGRRAPDVPRRAACAHTAPGWVAPPAPTISALQLAGSAAARLCLVARQAWLKAAPKRPAGCFQGWQRGLVTPRRFCILASPPMAGSSPSACTGGTSFACLLCLLGSPTVVLPCSRPRCARDPAQERKLQIHSFSAAT